MDRVEYYFRQLVTASQMNGAFDDVESAVQNVLDDLGSSMGVLIGLDVAPNVPADLNVLVALGVAYDKDGKRTPVAAQQTLDVSVDDLGVSTAVAGAGNEKWVSVFLKADRLESDAVIDGNGVTVYYQQADSFDLVVIQGTEALIGAAARPALDASNILLVDVYRTFGDLTIDAPDLITTRRETFILRSLSAANEISDNTVGGYHGANVQLSLDGLNTGLVGHENGGASKHDADEIDYEGTAGQVKFIWSAEVQTVLDLVSRALPVAAGVFKLADGADTLLGGSGWHPAPITNTGVGRYTLRLAKPIKTIAGAALDNTGLIVVATVGAKSVGFYGSYAWEHNPGTGGRQNGDVFTLQLGLPEAHAGAAVDAGPAAWAADPAANDSDDVRLSVVVYSGINFAGSLPGMYVS